MDTKICDEMLKYCKDNPHLGQRIDSDLYKNKIKKISTDYPIHTTDFFNPIKDYRIALQEILLKYVSKWEESNNTKIFKITENFNLQHYKPKEGYFPFHFENDGKKPNYLRHLVFMTYLNDVKDGGTEFLYQQIKTPAKKGLTVIWPAAWTHTHRGIISKTQEKFIVTGWFSFEE